MSFATTLTVLVQTLAIACMHTDDKARCPQFTQEHAEPVWPWPGQREMAPVPGTEVSLHDYVWLLWA